MIYQVVESETHPGHYAARATNYDGYGQIHSVVFLGPESQERAERFADWKNQRGADRVQLAEALQLMSRADKVTAREVKRDVGDFVELTFSYRESLKERHRSSIVLLLDKEMLGCGLQ